MERTLDDILKELQENPEILENASDESVLVAKLLLSQTVFQRNEKTRVITFAHVVGKAKELEIDLGFEILPEDPEIEKDVLFIQMAEQLDSAIIAETGAADVLMEIFAEEVANITVEAPREIDPNAAETVVTFEEVVLATPKDGWPTEQGAYRHDDDDDEPVRTSRHELEGK